jgi:uncharacterized protein YacL
MLLFVIRTLYLAICAGALASYVNSESQPTIINNHKFAAFIILLGLTQVATVVDMLIKRKRIELISAIYFGLLVGSLLSYLTLLALGPVIDPPFVPVVTMLTTLFLTYICISFLVQTRGDFRFVIPFVEFSRELKGGCPLLLDSSALIDGRVADLIETHMVDTEIVVPEFVLKEVQEIADSSDKTRRTRGRRGLDILAQLQASPLSDVRIYQNHDQRDGLSIDERIVHLAKELNARIVTNDFNLNKVATVQSIPVINLNDVANALKPRYVPGDRLSIKVIKRGEGPDQGVGYLDDGTMVVCENSSDKIGQNLETEVTSVLQSSAGRMVFVKPVP